MSEQTDTLASVAVELGKLLEPLRTEIVEPRTRGFFSEIGIPLTNTQATALGAPLTTIVDSTDELLTLIPDIISAIDAEDWGTVVEKAILATVKVGDAVIAMDALAAAAQGLAVPDADVLAKRIFDALIARYLNAIRGLNDVLEFIGLLDREDFNVDSVDPANPFFTLHTFDFGAIGDWLSDPAAKAAALYGWGSGFDGTLLFPRLERLIAHQGLPVFYDAAAGSLNLVYVEMLPTTSGAAGIEIRLATDFDPGAISLPLGPDATLEFDVAASMPLNTNLTIRSDGNVSFTPPTASTFGGELATRLIVRRNPPEPFVLFGQAESSRLEFGDFVLSVLAQLQASSGGADGQLDISGMLNDGKVVIDGSDGDGFIGKILPGTEIEADFSVLMGVSTERGFYFGGSSALEVRLPTHIELGPISIDALTLGAGLEDGEIPLSLGADIGAELGPISAVVQNMGVTATLSFPAGNAGNLGPAQFDIAFKPPNGVGLRVDAGPITGGGFLSLDFEKGEYIGALELSFKGVFTLKAVGIINTKMPDGSKGFALLILVTAEFTPIQLGFGFTLIGVGGLLGLNRSLHSDALRLGVRTGSVSSVLFPPDVVGNIVQIVSDLKSFFPIAEGHFIVAPMGKLGWGTPALITLEIGVILDIPVPQFTIIGVLRAILPEEDAPILKLQVNFAGGVDFDRGLIWFDASLFDSNLLVFTLSGDMALRIGWGDEKLFVISVGGFHPAFKEVPSDLVGMKRLGISLLSGNNPRLSVETYFAVTSNTVQSGARVELYAGAAGFNVYGFLGYDLLVQFNPFYFVAAIYAGLALRKGSSVIAGIDVFCELSGPTPWRARGHAKFKILFITIKIGFDEEWGQDPDALPVDTVDVLALMEAAVRDGRNWTTALPNNASQTVTLRQTDLPDDALLLHPFGVLSVSQKVAPLGLPIDKFGNQVPAGDTTFTISRDVGSNENAQEEFAIANFLELSDNEKLSRKSFESIWSGLRFATGDASDTGATVDKDIDYEMAYLRRKVTVPAGRFNLPKSLFDIMSGGGAVMSNSLSVAARKAGGNGPAAVGLADGGYQVVTVEDLSPAADGASAGSQAEAFALRDQLVREDPSLAGRIQVVADHELFMDDVA
ncbi:MAG: hypothetical protein OES10_13220 [Gammaproteobacteria bacterium]|nr:hypothetical protein [Gammaproteobacteria bacterium]